MAAEPPDSPGNVLSEARRPMPLDLAPADLPADLYPPALLPGPPPLLALLDTLPGSRKRPILAGPWE